MLKDIRQTRIKKLENIKKVGANPYPAISKRTHTIGEVILNFDRFVQDKKEITLTGRIRSWRAHGGATFAHIEDESGTIQIYFKRDILGDESYKFLENFDIGDFIQTKGNLFTTRKGEKTLLVSDYKILAKSLLPLPDKWYGLEDKEIRFRKRYLDLIMNKEVRERFVTRSKIIRELRNLLEKEGFIEVETPILEHIPGGAAAEPFVTHHNALDIDLYLRISPELHLKRLIVGGFEKVFEIGRDFRNEGVDRQHNPDFTMCEFYWAYKDYNDLIEFTQKLLNEIIKKIKGTLVFTYQGKKIDFTLPWKRVKFVEAIKEASGIDILGTEDVNELRRKIEERRIKLKEALNWTKLVDELYKETVRKYITSPVVFTDYPVELGPLAKSSAKDNRTVERFQVVVNGFELVNAYSELNDPIEQRQRLEEQVAKYRAGDKESPREVDEDYIEALEYGMPPTAGLGLGVDRLAALLTDSPSLRDIILFPTMRAMENQKSKIILRQAQDDTEQSRSVENQNDNAKSKNATACHSERSPVTKFTNFDTGQSEESLTNVRINITRNEALDLIKKNIKNQNTIKHMFATEAVMRALAKRFGGNEKIWGLTGLLHDCDMEKPEAINDHSKHGSIIAEELKKRGVSEIITSAIRAHNERTGEPRDTLIKKAIFAVDPLTGLIVACTLVRPDKKITSVTTDSVMKKFKDKAFARGADRGIIKTCEEFGLDLKEFIEIGLGAMKKIDKELGL